MSLMLQLTVSRPVCLGIKHSYGVYDQIFITVKQFRVCWFGASSLTRGRVCRVQLLLDLANAVFLGSESRETRKHNLLSQIRDFPFRCLLRLAAPRWRYSTRLHASTVQPLKSKSQSHCDQSLASESLVTRDHILLSLMWDFPFCRLAGSRWRYLTTPPHGINHWVCEWVTLRLAAYRQFVLAPGRLRPISIDFFLTELLR
jgi:hypothetical protein